LIWPVFSSSVFLVRPVRNINETIRFSTELPAEAANILPICHFPGSEELQDVQAKGELQDVDWTHFYFMKCRLCAGRYDTEGIKIACSDLLS